MIGSQSVRGSGKLYTRTLSVSLSLVSLAKSYNKLEKVAPLALLGTLYTNTHEEMCLTTTSLLDLQMLESVFS